MRFGKGSKVEVLSKRDVPSGSWFPAEIVSGNGRYYNVKCDGDHSLEKVQRRSIRPRPPPISRSGSWAPGDIVEVLENNSWKEAKIMEVIDGGNYAVVMLVESSEELKLHGSNIRIRRYWNDNRWVLGDKEFEHLNAGNMEISHDMEKSDNRKLQRRAVVNIRKGHNQFHAKNNSYPEEHCQFSLRGLRKRSSFCLPTLEGDARAGAGRKMGAIKEEVKRQRLLMAHSSKIPEKQCRSTPDSRPKSSAASHNHHLFDKANCNLSWLERWIAAKPWESQLMDEQQHTQVCDDVHSTRSKCSEPGPVRIRKKNMTTRVSAKAPPLSRARSSSSPSLEF